MRHLLEVLLEVEQMIVLLEEEILVFLMDLNPSQVRDTNYPLMGSQHRWSYFQHLFQQQLSTLPRLAQMTHFLLDRLIFAYHFFLHAPEHQSQKAPEQLPQSCQHFSSSQQNL